MSESSEFRVDQCWKAQSGEAWVAFESALDAQLGPLGRALLDRLAPRTGERALDIGCGSGQTLLELAERVGERGQVVGVDISDPMVARARERISAAGLRHVEIVLGDAQSQRFDEPFDLEFSRFGVMFFQDPVLAFRNLLQALKPGGRLGFVCFQASEKNEWAEVPLGAVMAAIGSTELPQMFQPDRPGPFFFARQERIRDVLSQAGYGNIVIEPEERKLHFGGASTLEQAVDYATKIGPAARAMADADQALVPACRAALAEALAPLAGPDGVWLRSAHYFVSARR